MIKTSGLKYVFGHGVWVLAGLLDQAVKLRTYIVEDNATIRENLIGTLEELASVEPVGFAETEDEGKVWLKERAGQWDLAIVDLFLRQGSGLGVLEACRERSPGSQLTRVNTLWSAPALWRTGVVFSAQVCASCLQDHPGAVLH